MRRIYGHHPYEQNHFKIEQYSEPNIRYTHYATKTILLQLMQVLTGAVLTKRQASAAFTTREHVALPAPNALFHPFHTAE